MRTVALQYWVRLTAPLGFRLTLRLCLFWAGMGMLLSLALSSSFVLTISIVVFCISNGETIHQHFVRDAAGEKSNLLGDRTIMEKLWLTLVAFSLICWEGNAAPGWLPLTVIGASFAYWGTTRLWHLSRNFLARE